MKKLVFTVALCFVVGMTFAQKKAISAAKNEIKSDKPNIEEARNLIKGAMENPETKDNAETYYVAGLIENKQFDIEKIKEALGQKPNDAVMYKSLGAILPYFLKADQLDQLPDEKGKVKPKFRKDMKSYLSANHPYYRNGGVYYNDQKDFKEAYNFFMTYLEIPKLPMFEGDKLMAASMQDSAYLEIKYYAAIIASQLGDDDGHKKAIALYESLKNEGFKQNEVYQYLCYEYEQTKDTVNLVKTLKEGVKLFPDEQYYSLSLINQYIFANQNDVAIEYLNEAIAKKPNDAQLLDVLGRIYENKGEIEKAIGYFQKALEINPNYDEAQRDMGRIYYNRAVEAQAAASSISDNKLYNEAITKVKDLFKQALPYFEKAHELKPDDRECMNTLRSIYYVLGMGEQLEKIEKEINGK
ncbi:tetratricopeptide repeat protein [Anaerosporobacter sp.]|uniref:tetratricopeptide repeat protein n=1 Tax=Anaerosporobacter sp. TaxID=1872529 RepID=UPI00286EF741|nr:tetratricopeptide repeat protein [Anaerosporobacter sp.]